MIPRRRLLAAGPLVLAACSQAQDGYFGNTKPPRRQHAVGVIDAEPNSLDPALAVGLIDPLLLSLFEGLTSLHPDTARPMAALATYYEVAQDGLRYILYLRGHTQPRGTPLPNTNQLPLKYSRGRTAPPDGVPARWSDGTTITAHDFVYSWRRLIDPSTAAEFAFLLYDIRNAEDISAGQLRPDQLCVRAADDFSLVVDLRRPAPYFLELLSSHWLCAVPAHAVEAYGKEWISPDRMVTSGAFRLRVHRPYDSLVLEKNPLYYDAGQVALDELTFLVSRDGATQVNQYRAGIAMVAYPSVPALLPALRRKKDFRTHQSYADAFISINTTTPPFDDVRVRYALNIATDKRPVTQFFGGGWLPASGLVPTSEKYEAPRTLSVPVGNKVYDVLSFNPAAARELLSLVAKPLPSPIEYIIPDAPDVRLWAQVLQAQWRKDIGVDLAINTVPFNTWLEANRAGKFRHLMESGSVASYVDPAWFLELFANRNSYGTHWINPEYRSMLAEANATANSALRLRKLSQCERHLLKGMPILPTAHWVNGELLKPFVRGFGENLLDRQQFKYVWIDTDWRPS